MPGKVLWTMPRGAAFVLMVFYYRPRFSEIQDKRACTSEAEVSATGAKKIPLPSLEGDSPHTYCLVVPVRRTASISNRIRWRVGQLHRVLNRDFRFAAVLAHRQRRDEAQHSRIASALVDCLAVVHVGVNAQRRLPFDQRD